MEKKDIFARNRRDVEAGNTEPFPNRLYFDCKHTMVQVNSDLLLQSPPHRVIPLLFTADKIVSPTTSVKDVLNRLSSEFHGKYKLCP